MCVVHHGRKWFFIETGHRRANPYKLVCRVIQFAWKHKVPVQRSSLTFYENEMPSRLDLGKTRYGGPFTFEQVEDVKAFLGILKVLLFIGPAFMLRVVSQSILPIFSNHGDISLLQVSADNSSWHMIHIEGVIHYVFISSGLLSPLLVVIFLPLYLFVLRPLVIRHIPGTMTTILKRIGLGFLLITSSLLCVFAMDVTAHKEKGISCMFNSKYSRYHDIIDVDSNLPLYKNIYFLSSQHVLAAFYGILIDTAILEFICSQSPYSMKGFLIGVLFSIRFLFEGSALALIIPFAASWNGHFTLSCGSGLYLAASVMGVASFIAYAYIAKQYKYRKRGEHPNIYQFAEDYYSKFF